MSDQSTKCPDCGGPLEAGKPCPNCLLKMALQPTGQLDADLDDLSVPADTTDGKPKTTVPDIEAVRAAFPQLEIIALIGRGGMGTVFKARQPKLDRYVALKILAADLAAKPAFADRFAREGKLLARLSHPNIVSVYDYGQSEGFYYLILEYVDGVNLRQAMREQKFSPEQALSIVPKICDALQYAHDEGVLHRDIKPENILLDTKGRIKITDFGIGKLTEQTDVGADSRARSVSDRNTNLTDTGQILGTPNYMAPEQLDAPATVDHRADIYSLGVVFYELLTGELPKGRFPLPSEKSPVDASVDEIVLKALERERDNRQQSAGEMKTAIEYVTGSTSVGKNVNETISAPSSMFLYVPLFLLGIFIVFSMMIASMSTLVPDDRDPTVRWHGWRDEPVRLFISPYLNPVSLLGVLGLIVAFVTSCGGWRDLIRGLMIKASKRSVLENGRIGSWFWALTKGAFGAGCTLTLIRIILILCDLDPETLFEDFGQAMLPLVYSTVFAFLVFMPYSMSILTVRGRVADNSRPEYVYGKSKPVSVVQLYFGIAISIFVMVGFCLAQRTPDVLRAFWDSPSMLLLFLWLVLWINIHRRWKTLGNGLLLKPDPDDGASCTAKFFDMLYQSSLLGGGLGMLLGIALVIIDLDPDRIGSGMAVALLCVLYALILSTLVFQPISVIMRNKTTDEDAIETETKTEKPGLWHRAVAEMKTWPSWATILVCIAVIGFGIPALISMVVIVVGLLVFLFGDLFEAITGYYGFQ